MGEIVPDALPKFGPFRRIGVGRDCRIFRDRFNPMGARPLAQLVR
jgi:hypothetical protein